MTPEQRDIAKTTNFAVIYGVTAFGLSRGLDIEPQGGAGVHRPVLRAAPEGEGLSRRAPSRRGASAASSPTLLGRRRYLPELRSGNPNLRGFGERMATNAPIQGTAADLIKIAMVRMAAALARTRLESRMLLQVHDELLFEAPPGGGRRGSQALATRGDGVGHVARRARSRWT